MVKSNTNKPTIMKKLFTLILFIGFGSLTFNAAFAQSKNYNSAKINQAEVKDKDKCANSCCTKAKKGTDKDCKESCCTKAKGKKGKAKKEKKAKAKAKEQN